MTDISIKGNKTISYQDLEQQLTENPDVGELGKLSKDIVDNYKRTDRYARACMAQKYYAGENVAINQRLSLLEKYGIKDSRVIFHRLKSGEFPRLVVQLSQYLLGNGVKVQIDGKDFKDDFGGGRFDNAIQLAGIQSLVDGVNWGYVSLAPIGMKNKYQLTIWRATEFAPVFDDFTGECRAGVRFYQVATDKPVIYTLYTEQGSVTFSRENDQSEVKAIGNGFTAYKTLKRTDSIGEQVLATNDWGGQLPIFPLYANELKRSELTDGIKGHIDAYDFISSDLADGITHVEGVYWYIKNYGGDNAAELIKEIQQLKATVQEMEASADNYIVEYPYKAKQIAMDYYKKQIRSDFMGLDTDKITGGSLTNVAIQTAEQDLGLKADKFEWQVATFIRNVFQLVGVADAEPQFTRRTMKNDTEMVENICKMIDTGQLTPEKAVRLNPLIPEEMEEEIIEDIKANSMVGNDTLSKYMAMLADEQ